MLIFLAEELVQELIKSNGLIQSQTAMLIKDNIKLNARIDSLEAEFTYFFNHELGPETNSKTMLSGKP